MNEETIELKKTSKEPLARLQPEITPAKKEDTGEHGSPGTFQEHGDTGTDGIDMANKRTDQQDTVGSSAHQAAGPDSAETKEAKQTAEAMAEGKQESESLPATGSHVLDLSTVGSIPVNLTLNVGSKEMLVGEIVSLKLGSVVQFERRESDPFDICVNGTLIGRGEVVLVGDQYGLRVLEIL